MEHYDNEQRLRILQERLGQIKNKQEARHDEEAKVDNTPPYPTYNPKATQSSNEDIAPEQTEKEKTPSTSPWKRIFTLLILHLLMLNNNKWNFFPIAIPRKYVIILIR